MNSNNFLQSNMFKGIVIAVGVLVLVCLAFGAGVFVGYRKARFSYAWGENYDRNFGGPHHGIFGMSPDPGFMSAHGVFGSIVSIGAGSSTLVISGKDNLEKTVLVLSSTALREGRDVIQFAEFKINDPVVVIGAPNDQGQISAQLIRVLKSSQ